MQYSDILSKDGLAHTVKIFLQYKSIPKYTSFPFESLLN